MGIILTAHLFDSLPLPGLNLDKFWQHNFIVSELAKFWAQKQGADNYVINASGLAGLLHDIGNLVILANFPMQYNNVLRKAAGDEAELLRLEYEEFGAGHPEVGGLALKFCNLPDDIIEAVELHHQLLAEGDRSLISKAVFIAERLVNSYSRQAGELVNSDDLMIMEDIDPTEIEDAWKKCGMIIDSV
jgi:HD-like signal output (HDOD) protein